MSNEYVISYDLMKEIMAVPREVLKVSGTQHIKFKQTPSMMRTALSRANSLGIDDGKLMAYNAYWDCQQDNGKKTNYHKFFLNGWNDELCDPKYDIKPTNASSMFEGCGVTNIKQCLSKIVFDTSNCTDFAYMFVNAISFKMPKIILKAGLNLETALEGMYMSCPNMIYAEIEFNKGVGSYSSTMFGWSQKLQQLVVSGKISNGGLNFSTCRELSKQSTVDIFGILDDDTSGLTITFSKVAVNAAFETSAGKKDGVNSAEWRNLVASKPNWTISLI